MSSKNLTNHKLVISWLFINYSLLLLINNVNSEPVDETESNSFGRIIYDQRQNGKYNIHVSIKDVAIIEMDQNGIQDESFGDEDYYYDESDLTVKPIKFSTTTGISLIKPTNLTTRSPVTIKPLSSSTLPTTLPTSTTSSRTFSVNLLSELAASHANQKSTQKAPNLVILSSTTPMSTPSKTQAKNGHSNILAENIPLPSFFRGVKQSRTPATAAQDNQPPIQPFNDAPNQDDSRIYKLKVRRNFRDDNKRPDLMQLLGSGRHPRRCRSNQYKDANGNCRNKRSSSILRKLFGMIVSLPFANERHIEATAEGE